MVTSTDVVAWLGLGLSALAIWRSGRVRVLDMRTALRKQRIELWHALEELEKKTIPYAVKSRSAVAGGRMGMLQQFREEAGADCEQLQGLRQQLATIEPIGALASYQAMEEKALVAHRVSQAVEQLRAKYHAAIQADDRERDARRADIRR